jgi:hypothetical protein
VLACKATLETVIAGPASHGYWYDPRHSSAMSIASSISALCFETIEAYCSTDAVAVVVGPVPSRSVAVEELAPSSRPRRPSAHERDSCSASP